MNKDLDYYISDIADPFSEDGTQEQMDQEGYLEFQWHSILDTIGTSECGINLRIFGHDIFDDLTKVGARNFLRDCYKRICEEYQMHTIEYHIQDSKVFDYTKKFLQMLRFFELDKNIEIFVDALNITDIKTVMDEDKLRVDLLNRQSLIYDRLMKSVGLPEMFIEYVKDSSPSSVIDTFTRLIEKNKMVFVNVKGDSSNDYN